MEEEILNELKTLNEQLKQDLVLRSDYLKLQQEKHENEKELQTIAAQEAEANAPEIELEKAKAEKRAVQIEQFITKIESDEEKEKQELSRQEMIQAINELDQTDSLTKIDENLNALLLESQTVTDDEAVKSELTYFNDRAIFLIILFFVPFFITIRYFSSLFDRASVF